MDESQKGLGDRVMRLWMRSVWNRIGESRQSLAPAPPDSGSLTLTVYREGRPEPLVLLSSRLQRRTLHFRTPDLLTLGERLSLRLAVPGLRLQLSARLQGNQHGNCWAELECSSEQLADMSRLLSRLGQAA